MKHPQKDELDEKLRSQASDKQKLTAIQYNRIKGLITYFLGHIFSRHLCHKLIYFILQTLIFKIFLQDEGNARLLFPLNVGG